MTTPDPYQPPRACGDCALRRHPAFTPVQPAELACIESLRSGVQRMHAGQSVMAERRAPTKVFTLYAGWAFRYKTLPDGRRQILNFLLPGDLVGLQAEFTDEATHGVEALTDGWLCAFAQDGLWTLYQQQPRLGYHLTWLSASQEQLVDDNLLTVGRRNAAERIATLLIHLWRRADRLGLADAAGAVGFPLTQQHMADALGLSLVHTNKTLRKLERLGLHEIEGGRLRLLQPTALARLAEYYAAPMRAVPLL